ncbi:hypothetical protein [Maridesulfovibrio sp.]|uniref:hypothetical protein n=1 Tax=Maridesulfovibrio sp. TaxID=2795000 RepID=UPI002A18D42A|nr:hypothetical protein [Maridesulfovibrio sp.]
MGGVVKVISKIANPVYGLTGKYDPVLAELNGDNKVETQAGPTTAELQAQREADEAAAAAEEKKLADVAAAKANNTLRKRQSSSTLATGALGLESVASVASKGLKTTLG